MKNVLKKIFIIIGILTLGLVITTPAFADDGQSGSYNCNEFLGLKAWYCDVVFPEDQEDLAPVITQIAGNILNDIAVIAAYLLIGYIIYGGYLYIFSSGEPGKTAAGKNTITRALIGLAITAFAKIIINSIGLAIGMNNNSDFNNTNCVYETCVNGNAIANIINWVIGIAGFVAAIYVVIGGIGYITSSGDSSKLQKSKNTILYSLIGLGIVGISLIISNYGREIINSANQGDDISVPIVALLNSVIGFLGVVALAFVIKGGFGYVTSTGDANKLKNAKDTILYACIGLIICALAFAIINWAVGVIGGSQ